MHRKTKSDGIIQTLNISQHSNINNNNNNETSSLYEELFDPSMIFVGIHSCYYWDSFDRIRKGKIFLTKTELLFKCSRMPFVRVRLYLNEIESIIKVKNFKNQSDSVLLISSNTNNLIKTFAFYKFRLPKNIIKNNIISLVKNLRQTNDDNETTTKGSKFNLSSKIRKSVTDLKNIIKTPNHMSKSNSDLINNSNNNIENMDYLRNNDYLKKSASNSFLDSTPSVVFRKLNNPKQQDNDILLQQERKFSSLASNKKTMRRVKRSSKDSDSNTSPELEEKNDKRQGIFIKNNKSRPASTNSYQDNTAATTTTTVNQIINNKRPASMNETKRESISNKAEYLEITNQQINELNLVKKNTLSSARSSKMSSSSSVSTSSTSSSQESSRVSSLSIKETDINEYKKQIKEQLRLNSIVKNNNNNNNQESECNNLNRISMNNNHIQTNNNNNNNGLGSNFLIIFFLIAILIYSLMTIVNFVKLCFLENSINFDL